MLCKYMKQFEHKKHSSTTALASNTQLFFFVKLMSLLKLLSCVSSAALHSRRMPHRYKTLYTPTGYFICSTLLMWHLIRSSAAAVTFLLHSLPCCESNQSRDALLHCNKWVFVLLLHSYQLKAV